MPSLKLETISGTVSAHCRVNGPNLRVEGGPPELFQDAIRVLTGKWKVELIWTLVHGTHRFGQLRRALPGITQHMLTTQLRELEADGLVKRTAYAEIPPRVEYEVTEAAYALKPMFRELIAWSQAHGPLARQTAVKSNIEDTD